MADRVILLEPSLTTSTGHFATTVERLTAFLAPSPVVVVPGPASTAKFTLGRNSSPRFKHSRTAIARIRQYGPTGEKLIRHAEIYLPALLRRHRNWFGVAEHGAERSRAQGEATYMRALVINDLLGILRSIETDKRDLLFFPSTDAELILAAAELHRLQPLGPPIALRVMYDDFGAHSTAPTWRSALGLLLALPGARRRFHLFAETLRFAAALRDSFAQDVTLFPHLTALRAGPAPVLRGEFVFLVPGTLRPDKGEHLLKQIGPYLAEVLQSKALPFVTIRSQLRETLACDKFRFEPLPSRLTDDDYATQWRNCHAALLLNDPTIFQLRGSGTACDAVASHRPFLALKGSSLGEWITKDNGFLVEADPPSVAHGVANLVENYHKHTAGCLAASMQLDTCQAEAIHTLRSLLTDPCQKMRKSCMQMPPAQDKHDV